MMNRGERAIKRSIEEFEREWDCKLSKRGKDRIITYCKYVLALFYGHDMERPNISLNQHEREVRDIVLEKTFQSLVDKKQKKEVM